jgi:hypothetical protein
LFKEQQHSQKQLFLDYGLAEAPPGFQRLPQERTKLIGLQTRERGGVSGERVFKPAGLAVCIFFLSLSVHFD